MNINITDNAAEYIKRQIENSGNNYAVRVFIKSKGCCSLDLGIAYDIQKATDYVYNKRGVSFIVDIRMAKYIKGFKVDVVNSFLGARLVVEDMYKSTC